MAHKKPTGSKAQKKVTRYTYNEIKEPRTPETEHAPLLPAEEQVVTPPDGQWLALWKLDRSLGRQDNRRELSEVFRIGYADQRNR